MRAIKTLPSSLCSFVCVAAIVACAQMCQRVHSRYVPPSGQALSRRLRSFHRRRGVPCPELRLLPEVRKSHKEPNCIEKSATKLERTKTMIQCRPTRKSGTLIVLLTALLLVPELGHCFYNPSTGRWLSRDALLADDAFSPDTTALKPEMLMGALPIEGPNLYGFVHQTPTGFVDGFGLFSMPSVDEIPCLAAKLGVGQCCAGRFTGKLEVDKLGTPIAGIEFKFETRVAVQRCMSCCGDRTTISVDVRGGGDIYVGAAVPAPVPIIVRVFGGASVGGAIVTRIDGCTGTTKASGCKFFSARFGAEGCATLGFGRSAFEVKATTRRETVMIPP